MKRQRVHDLHISHDVWYLICTHLAPLDLLSMRQVSRDLRCLIQEERTWALFKRGFEELSVYKERYLCDYPMWKFFTMLKNTDFLQTRTLQLFINMQIPKFGPMIICDTSMKIPGKYNITYTNLSIMDWQIVLRAKPSARLVYHMSTGDIRYHLYAFLGECTGGNVISYLHENTIFEL